MIRQDKAYWSKGFNFDFKTDGKGISHYFDFIEVCGDNHLSVMELFSLIGRGKDEGEKIICRSLEWINSELI